MARISTTASGFDGTTSGLDMASSGVGQATCLGWYTIENPSSSLGDSDSETEANGCAILGRKVSIEGAEVGKPAKEIAESWEDDMSMAVLSLMLARLFERTASWTGSKAAARGGVGQWSSSISVGRSREASVVGCVPW